MNLFKGIIYLSPISISIIEVVTSKQVIVYAGMMAGGNISSVHHESKDMSFSIIEGNFTSTICD